MSGGVVVTGGSGFLGSTFVRRAVSKGQPVVNVDAGTYAADERRLQSVRESADWSDLRTEQIDVATSAFTTLVRRLRPSVIVHFAAQTHVTRSENNAEVFAHANVDGTRGVLKAAEESGTDLVLHVSTDGIYGPCLGPPFREEHPVVEGHPATSAYAKSKARADEIARHSFPRVPVIVARLSNCFGPWQHPEKAIARWTVRALQKRPIPVWGDGNQVRDWMHAEDATSGLELLIERGTLGMVYNIAPQGRERTNLEVARSVATAAGHSPSAVYLSQYDRPLHDRRYAIDASRILELGWRPVGSFDDRLLETVDWYRLHPSWWEPLLSEAEALYSDELEISP
jgi:dTDP-glucose 4,6-dehydratase